MRNQIEKKRFSLLIERKFRKEVKKFPQMLSQIVSFERSDDANFY